MINEQIQTSIFFGIKPKDDDTYESVFHITELNTGSIIGRCFAIGSWSYDHNTFSISPVDDDIIALYLRWDGCHHYNSTGYDHICDFGDLVRRFRRDEAGFFLVSKLVSYSDNEGFPSDYEPDFESATFKSRTGDEITVDRIDPAIIENIDEVLDIVRGAA